MLPSRPGRGRHWFYSWSRPRSIVRDGHAAVALGRDDRLDTGRLDFLADRVGVIAFVRKQGFDLVFQHPEQRTKAVHVMRLAWRQDEAERPAAPVTSGVELGGEAAARPAKLLVLLIPFFSPTAQ